MNYRFTNLKKLQQVELEILSDIDRVCRKNNLKYYLIGGSLLGAIRHQGFIPWDDDIDIALPRKDYDLFCTKFYKELDPKYSLRNFDTDRNYWLPYSKVEKLGTEFIENQTIKIMPPPGIFVDVFALDTVCSQNGFFKKKLTWTVRYLSSEIHYRRTMACGRRNFKAQFLFFPLKLFKESYLIILIRFLQTFFENSKDGMFYINYNSYYSGVKETYPKDVFGEPKEADFQGLKVFVPHDSHYVLKRVYGATYMELPPEEKRVTHSPLKIIFS